MMRIWVALGILMERMSLDSKLGSLVSMCLFDTSIMS
jgi:hypothetical protein